VLIKASRSRLRRNCDVRVRRKRQTDSESDDDDDDDDEHLSTLLMTQAVTHGQQQIEQVDRHFVMYKQFHLLTTDVMSWNQRSLASDFMLVSKSLHNRPHFSKINCCKSSCQTLQFRMH